MVRTPLLPDNRFDNFVGSRINEFEKSHVRYEEDVIVFWNPDCHGPPRAVTNADLP
jgi:hypothetical protein